MTDEAYNRHDPKVKRPRITGKRSYVFGNCCYCEVLLTQQYHKADTFGTREHIIPKSKGGYKTEPCCRRCNAMRGNRRLADFLSVVCNDDTLGVCERVTMADNIRKFMKRFTGA